MMNRKTVHRPGVLMNHHWTVLHQPVTNHHWMILCLTMMNRPCHLVKLCLCLLKKKMCLDLSNAKKAAGHHLSCQLDFHLNGMECDGSGHNGQDIAAVLGTNKDLHLPNVKIRWQEDGTWKIEIVLHFHRVHPDSRETNVMCGV